jgi:hypothetical protein
MKRLFEVVLSDGSTMIPRAYFETKGAAKVVRDSLNKNRVNEEGFVGFTIRRGPDHQMFGVRGHPTTNDNRRMKVKRGTK